MSQLITMLNHFAGHWFSFVYHVTWQASLLAVLLLVVVRFGRRWHSPLRYGLLILALVKFTLPPLVALPTGLFSQASPPVQMTPAVASVAERAVAGGKVVEPVRMAPELWGEPVASRDELAGLGAKDASVVFRRPAVAEVLPVNMSIDSKVWLMLMHLLGALVVTFWILKNWLSLRASAKRAVEVRQGELYERFVTLTQKFAFKRLPRLLVSYEPCGPAAFGVFRPVVILPESIASLNGAELDAVLSHELAHHHRCDPLVNWVQLALATFWWFNPLIWILNRQIRSVREDCCDDMLLNMQLTTNEQYCETLLGTASKIATTQKAGVALGFADNLHPLGRRFERIMDRTLRRVPRLPLMGLLLLLVLACVVLPGVRRADGDSSASTETEDLQQNTERLESQTSQSASEEMIGAAEMEVGETAPIEITAVDRAEQGQVVRLRVVDEDGKPVPQFQAMVRNEPERRVMWLNGADGVVVLGESWGAEHFPAKIIIRADGYASTLVAFTSDEQELLLSGNVVATLQRGQKVELQFRLPSGMTWPEAVEPDVYFDAMQSHKWFMRATYNTRAYAGLDFNYLNQKWLGGGKFEFRVAEETPAFYVAVHWPGFIQHYESGPYTSADVHDGVLSIDFPRPATLEISFAPSEEVVSKALFKNLRLMVFRKEGINRLINTKNTMVDSSVLHLNFTDLAPGDYLIDAMTEPTDGVKEIPGLRVNPGRYQSQQGVTLSAGQLKQITISPEPYNPEAYKGDREAIVRIQTANGEPAAGRDVQIERIDSYSGAQIVFSGTVPESGEILLTGISDRKIERPAYQVKVNDKHLPAFDFTTESGTETFSYTLPPEVGELAPDVELIDAQTEEKIPLSSFRGKLVLLEFWASWFGPSHHTIEELNSLAMLRENLWRGEVAIVPVSIDADLQSLRNHVRLHGLNELNHYWSGETVFPNYTSPVADAFLITKVPEAILLNKEGRILWRGHLLEADIDEINEAVEQALMQD